MRSAIHTAKRCPRNKHGDRAWFAWRPVRAWLSLAEREASSGRWRWVWRENVYVHLCSYVDLIWDEYYLET